MAAVMLGAGVGAKCSPFPDCTWGSVAPGIPPIAAGSPGCPFPGCFTRGVQMALCLGMGAHGEQSGGTWVTRRLWGSQLGRVAGGGGGELEF